MAKRFLSIINVTNLSSDPGSATDGDIYYNIVTDQLRIYANGSWTNVASGSLPSQTGNSGKYLTTDGTTASWGTIQQGGGSVQTDVALSNSWWLGV